MIFHSLQAAFADHQEVVPFIGGIAYDFCTDIPVLKLVYRVFPVKRISVGLIIGIRQPGMQFSHFLNQGLVGIAKRKIFGNVPESPVHGPGKRAGNIIYRRILEFIEIEQQRK